MGRLVPCLAAVVTAAALLAACGDDSSGGPESALESTGPQAATASPFRDPTPVIDALNQEVGGPSGQTRVTSAGIYQGYAIFEAQDPDMPRNLDRYYYDGKFDPPEPVMVSATATPETELFSVGEVNWAAIPDLAEQALDELALEGAMVTVVSVLRISGEVTIQIPVTGTRMRGYLRATAGGRVIDVAVS